MKYTDLQAKKKGNASKIMKTIKNVSKRPDLAVLQKDPNHQNPIVFFTKTAKPKVVQTTACIKIP